MKTRHFISALLIAVCHAASAQVVTIDDPNYQTSNASPQQVQYTQPVQQTKHITQPSLAPQQAAMSPGSIPLFASTRNYVSLSGQIWLPNDALFEEGGGIISEDEKVQFYGFGIEFGTSISANNHHWAYFDLRYGFGTYDRETDLFLNPNNPHKSDRFLLENDMFQLSVTGGYRYLRPLTRGVTMHVGAFAGFSSVGFYDPFYTPYNDPYNPYYDPYYYNDSDWADNSEFGVVVGAELGFEFQITPSSFLAISYGIEFHSASPDYEFSKQRRASARSLLYHNISVGFGWQF